MPFCPVCKYEYKDDICRCPDCDVDLVDQLPDEDPEIPVASPDDELTYEIQSSKPLETSALKDMLHKSGTSIFSSPVMIVIVGIIFNSVLYQVLFGIWTMFGMDFRHGANSIMAWVFSISTALIPIFIMGLVMGKFAPQRSVRTAFLTGLVMTLSISVLGTLILLLIPHRSTSTHTSQAWVLWELGMILWQLVQAGIFLGGFLLSRKRNCPEALD